MAKKTKTEKFFNRLKVGETLYIKQASCHLSNKVIKDNDLSPRVVRCELVSKSSFWNTCVSLRVKMSGHTYYLSHVRMTDISRKEAVVKRRAVGILKKQRAYHNRELKTIGRLLQEYKDA